MIPYFQFTTIPLGPLTIQVWGFFVALGILAGAWAASRMARKKGQDEKLIWDLSVWVIVGAFLMARVLHVVYEPGYYLADPLEFFRVWHGGFSIMGGFLGALIAGVLFLRRRHVDVWAYCDTAVFGLPLGIFIGRIGCFLIHDHPGTLTDFALGVKYPDGVRHDHGLYDSINGLVLFLLFLWLARRNAKTGTYIVVFLIWYGTVRFFLDFLRATNGPIVDTRYFSLTPAQYLAIVMVVGGVWLYQKRLKKKIKKLAMQKQDTVHFVLTGGTIDSFYNSVKDTATPREHSIVPTYIELLKLYANVEYTEVCMKDSRSLDKIDREKILEAIEASSSTRIIITHGTYTMPDTARFLKSNLGRHDQTVILTGSMIPLEGFSPSDGGFNLGYAFSQVQSLPAGIYVCMNGHVFDPDEVVKMLGEGRFDSIFNR